MFRTNAASHCIASLSVAAASICSYSLSECAKTRPVCHSEAAAPSNKNATYCKEQDPFRVLVVGSGLTGCLTALRIRQRVNNLRGATNARPAVEVTVVERATYPAGRFGATATFENCVADIGAQVLSTINPNDHRALGGHGVQVKDIKLANELVQRLLSDGTIIQAREETLGETEERMIWEGLWRHYFAPSGMVSVLRKLLDWADVRPSFGVRIDSIDMKSNDLVRVKGISRRSTESTGTDDEFCESFNSLVLCIPAPNVLEIDGVLNHLSMDSRHVLEKVGYDQRTCEAHFFSSEFSQKLATAFQDEVLVELMVEDLDETIQYISWQNRKSFRRTCTGNDSIVALVVHGQAGQLHPLGGALDRTLSMLTGKSLEEIASHRLYSKRIPWRVCQMITPMEAVVADPPSPAWQCIVGEDRRLIIAGDFMTQSSFLGCVASADAAARAVVASYVKAKGALVESE